MGCGAGIGFGGQQLHSLVSSLAAAARTLAGQFSHEAGEAAKIGSYARREQEWAFQSNMAAGEINQLYKQLRAAQIREAVAEQELANHRKQMQHAEEIRRFLNEEGTDKNGKQANKALYVWMKRETKGLYAQVFQFAFDVARKAERALQHELGNTDLSFLQFGYMAGKEGLLAGDRLFLDIKRMETSYHELNQRELELTKHVSLLQVDPLALIQLRTTGQCTVSLPELLFDMDGPGHYFRRIRSVALSIPCVAGPYVSVSCTLALLKSSIRKTPRLLGDCYVREDANDERFSDYFGRVQSIVTSSAQNDSGLFETNLRDERYLPFENSGVISEWRLQLPADLINGDPPQFDYGTIADVVLHLRYTARDGGNALRDAATKNIKTLVADTGTAGTLRLFSVRHEFPAEWIRFRTQAPGAQRFELTLTLQPEHYPYWSQEFLNEVTRVDILARLSADSSEVKVYARVDASDTTPIAELSKEDSLGGLQHGVLIRELPERPCGKLSLFFTSNAMSDLWLAVSWRA